MTWRVYANASSSSAPGLSGKRRSTVILCVQGERLTKMERNLVNKGKFNGKGWKLGAEEDPSLETAIGRRCMRFLDKFLVKT